VEQEFTHIDLFAGIGGFTLGLHQSGLNIGKLYFSEIDKYAISVYRRNFPDAEYLGSVDTISGRGLKGRNTIITFGFPCQDLSVAGKRKGFDGSRSSLFFEAMRIIEEVRPSIFIFENVKGFYSSNDGKDFTIALQTIADLGLYECQWQLLNTAWFLPQNRERVYFVGSLGTENRPEVFPIFKPIKSGCEMAETTHYERDWYGSGTLRARGASTWGAGDLFIEDGGDIRFKTTIEHERLQGFPDNWTKYGDEGQEISDTQRYKMCGNAVSVPVVKAIGERLINRET